MHKIAAFINFNNFINDIVFKEKKKVRQIFGNQIYLSHPVHSTLFSIDIIDIKKFSKELTNHLTKEIYLKKSIFIKLYKTDVFIDDELTDGHTIYYAIEKNYELEKLQLLFLNFIKNLDLIRFQHIKFNHKWMNINYAKFGFPYVGNKWIPHVTVASIREESIKHPYFSNFLNNKISLIDEIKYIHFYEIIDDAHNFLFKIAIQ